MKTRIVIIAGVLLLEIFQYGYSAYVATDLDLMYSLTSRYSARISFAILVILSWWITVKGLLTIVGDLKNKDWLLGAIAAFTINHLIHFYFLSKNFEVNDLDVWEKVNSFGTLAYIILTIAPVFFWTMRLWTRQRYYLLHLFLGLMIGVCVFTYASRFSRVDPLPFASPMWLFKLFIGMGLVTIIGLVYRVIIDRKHWQ